MEELKQLLQVGRQLGPATHGKIIVYEKVYRAAFKVVMDTFTHPGEAVDTFTHPDEEQVSDTGKEV